MHESPSPGPAHLLRPTDDDTSLSRALSQGLDTPLTALRAAMETLGYELRAGAGVGALRIEGVLEEVERLGKNVRELCDLASNPVPRPLTCTLDEIVHSARAPLTLQQRERVLAARCEPSEALRVDGPLLAGALRRLVENALEASDDLVLLLARIVDGHATFSVLDGSRSELGPDWRPTPFRTTKPNHMGLGLTLTQRDVELLGGTLEFPSNPNGRTCVRISIPLMEQAR
jgi:signal transduction histidine kinase